MKTNAQIADVFEQLADLLEFQGANAFRIRAYRSAARAISRHTESIGAMIHDDPKRLQAIGGIGKAVAEKCGDLVRTGRLAQLDQLLEEIPESVLTLLRIPGLGAKKAAVLFRELGVTTLDALQAACGAHQVRGLKGFGVKTEAMILRGIAIADAASHRIYWSAADNRVSELDRHFEDCPTVERIEFAGSYRRGCETVGDLDILVQSSQADTVMDWFSQFPEIDEVLLRGPKKMSVRVDGGLQVDLRVVPPSSFGAALQYFTGSKEHNVALRSRARQLGLKINEYGVSRVAEDANGGDDVAGETEEEVYRAIGLTWIPPELREGRDEIEAAEAGQLPTLIETSDIVGDLHMHTTATDGRATLEEMVAAARERGRQYVAITDHSQRVSMARGLDSDRLREQWARIDQINAQSEDGFRILKGIECDILERGGMDLPDDVLAEADWVVASLHYGQRQPSDQITGRIIDAIEHPAVSVIAHPTGRLINRREAYEVDMDRVLDAAGRWGKLMELNANPARLDLHDVHCAAARERGVPIVISSDAHSTIGLDVIRYGVLQARRGGLRRSDVANTRSCQDLLDLVGKTK